MSCGLNAQLITFNPQLCTRLQEHTGLRMDKYYKEQLTMLREGASAFARQYPALAPMLLNQGGDPDVERILEGTAWLCSRLHERLDQTAPDLIQSLLRLVFPQAILPVPSTSLVHFTLQPGFAEVLEVPRGVQIASNPVDGVPCIYSTFHDLRILPMSATAVRHEAHSDGSARTALTLSSQTPLQKILGNSLTLHLAGNYALAANRLMALLTRLDHVEVQTGGQRLTLPATSLRQAALPLTDLRLPPGRRSNRAFMELVRYFHFPEQLLFVQLEGLEQLHPDGLVSELQLDFCFKGGPDPVPEFDADSFALNVVTVVNVFRVASDPLVIDHTQEEYLIRPQDGNRRFLEILALDRVTALLPGGRTLDCTPYDAYDGESKGILYSLRYRPAGRNAPCEHLISPIYRPETGPEALERYTLSLDLLCCNYSLPNSLRVGDLCRPTDSSPSRATFTNIVTPAPMLPRPSAESLQWRLLSFLNTNLLSLASPAALRSLLELYLPEEESAPELAAATLRRCQAVKGFSARSEERLFRGRLLRGRALSLTLDPAGFVSDGDLFLFANSLDRFLTEFASINTYTRLLLTVAGTGVKRQWPPRLGEKRLL